MPRRATSPSWHAIEPSRYTPRGQSCDHCIHVSVPPLRHCRKAGPVALGRSSYMASNGGPMWCPTDVASRQQAFAWEAGQGTP